MTPYPKLHFGSAASDIAIARRVNLLTAGIFQLNFRLVTFKLMLVIDGWVISYEIAFI